MTQDKNIQQEKQEKRAAKLRENLKRRKAVTKAKTEKKKET